VAYVSNADSGDISVLAMDRQTGALQPLQTLAAGANVMPLALSPDRRTLYAAVRSTPWRVLAYRIDSHTGLLTPLGEAPLPESMAHIATDASGRFLFAASYGGHLLSVSPLQEGGAPAAARQLLGTGRHAHAAIISPDQRHLFVTNLGEDQILQLHFDAASGQVEPHAQPALKLRAHSGPRHLVFHPGARWAYLLNELDARVDLLAYDAAAGTLAFVNSGSTLPPGFSGRPWAADLHLTPDGRFLYTSERTSSTLALWRVEAATGELALLGHQATEENPRGFQIDPRGQWLLVAGQNAHSVSSYRIDSQTGLLTHMARQPVGRGPNWVEFIELR
jgi:6-phosphogluconolactonase